ncbi:PKD domain-containing protein [Pseudoalteromonas luteoviolacea]|uniref:PKD domain-containing protein n=1 Tax=Pseudoalteromonas luteoviolacea TaxID=43657 RepID=UPI001F33CA41|nr:PKD domain-containing protein [Pseudoalteromonas luteoviolacea]MCF6441871.1 PKD domain-containing protein [Pseudoalteromonas luteoviolacea]
MEKMKLAALVTGCLIGLSACGGDGDNETNTTPPPSKVVNQPLPSPEVNQPPAASIAADANAQERSLIQFDGSGSSDSDGSISSYDWSLDLGDYKGNAITLASSGASAELNIGDIAEDVEVTIKLEVTDDDGATDSTQSSLLINEIDFMKLPPLPASPQEGLLGTDSDGDGVRDDVEHKILERYPLSIVDQEVYRKVASTMNSFLVAGLSSDDIDDVEASQSSSYIADCLFQQYGEDAIKELTLIEVMMIDTDERLSAYLAYSNSRSGKVQESLDAPEGFCRLPQN